MEFNSDYDRPQEFGTRPDVPPEDPYSEAAVEIGGIYPDELEEGDAPLVEDSTTSQETPPPELSSKKQDASQTAGHAGTENVEEASFGDENEDNQADKAGILPVEEDMPTDEPHAEAQQDVGREHAGEADEHAGEYSEEARFVWQAANPGHIKTYPVNESAQRAPNEVAIPRDSPLAGRGLEVIVRSKIVGSSSDDTPPLRYPGRMEVANVGTGKRELLAEAVWHESQRPEPNRTISPTGAGARSASVLPATR
jgi:hypothetical protein